MRGSRVRRRGGQAEERADRAGRQEGRADGRGGQTGGVGSMQAREATRGIRLCKPQQASASEAWCTAMEARSHGQGSEQQKPKAHLQQKPKAL